MPSLTYWSIPCDWPGETVFIIGGGLSVLAFDPELLRGRRVIALNSSWERFPFADYLVFSDPRWWSYYGARALKGFPGKIVGVTKVYHAAPFLRLNRKSPPGLADGADTVVFQHTVSAAGIDMASKLTGRGGTIVLCGLDGKPGKFGVAHHHSPHPWKVLKDAYANQRGDLESLVDPLKQRGVDCFNANPDSAFTMFPFRPLSEFLSTVVTHE